MSRDLTKSVIDRLMNLREFTVKVPVEAGWLPNGVVPFDIKIKNNIATVTLPALTSTEARERVLDYFRQCGHEED
jgi:hypothetical protein